MRASARRPAPHPRSPLVAAARLAQDGRFSVGVVLPGAPQRVLEAEAAAEQAGVDIAVEPGLAGATVHFVARHQDRQLTAGALVPGMSRSMLRPVPAGPSAGAGARQIDPEPPGPTPPPALIDLVAFRRASDALALNQARDAEADLIWGRLLRARARAHVCGGMPTLIVNDVGGLVGLLRRRARERGVALRINPDVCACG